MSETIMKLNNDGRIVQIDNVSWSYYIDVDRARSLEDHKSGKWMHFFNDISFAAAICRKAVLEGTVAEGSCINCEVTLTVNGKSKTFVPKAICNGKVSDGIYVRPRIG